MDNLIELPKKPIDPNAELMRLAGSSKIVSGFFNQDGEFHSFLGDDLTYCDMLFIIDSLRRRMDKIYPS